MNGERNRFGWRRDATHLDDGTVFDLRVAWELLSVAGMPRRKKQGDPPRLVSIEGAIGAGKTLVARALAERTQARLVEEDVEANPFVARFYAEPRRTAFQAQMYFLLSRYRRYQTLKQGELFQKSTVVDHSFFGDRVFAYATLNEAERSLYDKIYGHLARQVPTPDLMVYLQARPETLLERIRERNRAWERPITLEFLEKVAQSYNDFFFRYKDSSLLVINTSDLQLTEKDQHLDEVLSAIRRMGKGTQHYNPFVTKR